MQEGRLNAPTELPKGISNMVKTWNPEGLGLARTGALGLDTSILL